LAVAEAMPEDHYEFVPTAGEFRGVRTFAQQLKHVAAANYRIGAAMLAVAPAADAASESGPDSMHSKEDILDYLTASFAYLRGAVAHTTEPSAPAVLPTRASTPLTGTRLGLRADAIDHAGNHYGQMVEYLRMNGIVPPPSR